jgi:hypothetical protein
MRGENEKVGDVEAGICGEVCKVLVICVTEDVLEVARAGSPE